MIKPVLFHESFHLRFSVNIWIILASILPPRKWSILGGWACLLLLFPFSSASFKMIPTSHHLTRSSSYIVLQFSLLVDYCRQVRVKMRPGDERWGSRKLYRCSIIETRKGEKPQISGLNRSRAVELSAFFFCFLFRSSSPMSASVARDGVGGFTLPFLFFPLLPRLSFLSLASASTRANTAVAGFWSLFNK